MNPTLLLVDDEPSITDAIESSLLDEHYTIFKAGCAAEALSVLELHPVTVVVADQDMPGMSGIDLCAAVHQKWPTTYRILLSTNDDTELAPASISGDIHQYLAKPWDAMLLRYNINEGIRQQKILQQALLIRSSFQQPEQACFITDANWVIQIVSKSAADWLGIQSALLIGKNLFSHQISQNTIEDETHLITALESQAHWQGSFHLNTQSIHGNEAWMSIVPFADQHYLCLAIPMIDDMLNKLNSDTHATLANTEALTTNKPNFHYLLIRVQHEEKLNLDFMTIINERLQLVCDNLYHIIATAEGDQIIHLPNSFDKLQIDHLLALIHQTFIQPILFNGREHIIEWSSEEITDDPLMAKRAEKHTNGRLINHAPTYDHNTAPHQHKAYLGHSYYQPHHYEQTGFSCLPIFDQHGQAIALMPPHCPQRDNVEQWLHDALNTSQEWRNYSDQPVHWLNDLSDLKVHLLLKSLAAIASLRRQDSQAETRWTLILNAYQLVDIRHDENIQHQLKQLNIKLLVKNPDYHLNTIKQLSHDLPRLFAGLCIDSHWLFDNRDQIKRHSMQLLNHLRNSDLLVLATDITTAQQLASLHSSPCHWLAGEMLSVKLLPQQISWLHQ